MNLRILTVLTVVFALLSSCNTLREGTDDCPVDYNARILVKVEAEELGLDVSCYIQTAQVFVFDAVTGMFVAMWEGGHYTPGEEYEVLLSLPAGKYKFVVWTNLHEDMYGMSHTADELNDMHIAGVGLFMNLADDRTITDDHPDLLHGVKEADIVHNRSTTVTILIRPTIHRVTFVVTGLPKTTDEYGFTVGDNDFRLDFHNNLVHLEQPNEFRHSRTAYFSDVPEESELTASMTILGLTDTPSRIPPAFTFANNDTGEWLYPWQGNGAAANLVDMVIETYKAQNGGAVPDFSTTFEFLVPLRYDDKIGMQLDLRPWDYQEDEWILF